MRHALRKAREDKGASVDVIAKTLGISESFYYKIEQGIRNPTIQLARIIAILLEHGVEELFFADQLDVSPKATGPQSIPDDKPTPTDKEQAEIDA